MSIVWSTHAPMQAAFEELLAAGYTEAELKTTYTDQDGGVWFMTGAKCPRCEASSKLSHRLKGSGYFVCPSCGVMYDEPNFDPDDLITVIENYGEA